MSELLPEEFLGLFSGAARPPKRLFFRGRTELLAKKKIALIGSRRMSAYTQHAVAALAGALKNAGVCVVSGGALGTDIIANAAALPDTIAVFANGLDQIYPRANEKIIRQIYAQGLALSEYEEGYLPAGYDFLLRNRLIIALAEAVIIAQADLKSGSMQSARLAHEMQKPIFVLPQRLGESEGTNSLLERGGARLIADLASFARDFAASDLAGEAAAGPIQARAEEDELLAAVRRGMRLNELIKAFGDRVYEYELHGRVEISGLVVRVVG